MSSKFKARSAKSGTAKTSVNSKYGHIAVEIHNGLASLREDGVCTDFEVEVGGRNFHCHRAVLAAVSDYFRAMFQSGMKETLQSKTTLDNICPEAFKVILDLLYVKDSDPDPLSDRTDDELGELLRVADMFQMKFLSKLCLELFAKTMAANNSIQRWKLGRNCPSEELRQIAWKYIIGNFENVAKGLGILSLNFEHFISIISENSLKVSDEGFIWQAVSDWIDVDRDNREDKLTELLKQCCLTEIDSTVLIESIAFDDKIRCNAAASNLVQESIQFKNHPGMRDKIELKFRDCMDKEQVGMLIGVCEDDKTIAMAFQRAGTDQLVKGINIPTLLGDATEYACCVHGQDVYVSGGTGHHDKLLQQYSGSNHVWKIGAVMLYPLRRHAMVATDDHLYTVGGRMRTVSDEVLQYSLRKKKWKKHGTIMAPVENASAVCIHDKIYIIGGVLSSDVPTVSSDSVQMYDTKTNTTTILQCQLPSSCAFSCAISRQDQIFIVTCNGEIVRLSGKKLESNLVATIPDFKVQKHFAVLMKGEELSIYGGVAEDEGGNKVVSDKVLHVDATSGKVREGKALAGRYVFYGAVRLVVQTK